MRTRTNSSIIFAAFFGVWWVSHWDVPSIRLEGVLAFGVFFAFVLVAVLIDNLLARMGVQNYARSGIWASAMLGPLIGFAVFDRWGYPVLSQVVGFASTVLAFGVFYVLDKAQHRD